MCHRKPERPAVHATAVVLLLIVTSLAGCLGLSDTGTSGLEPSNNDTEPTPPPLPAGPTQTVQRTTPTGEAVGERVLRYTGTGDLLPVPEPAELGTTAWTLVGEMGAEPNIGITSDGSLFVTAFDNTMRSRDGGTSWESVYEYSILDDLTGHEVTFTNDPMLWVDPVTDRIYTAHLYSPGPAYAACTNLIWSDDGGGSWIGPYPVCPPAGMDHEKLVTGIPGPDALPPAGGAHPTVAYMCYNKFEGGATHCSISYDGGLTWPLDVAATDEIRHTCAGTGGHPAIGPRGEIVVPTGRGCEAMFVTVSLDAGLSWTTHQVPGDIDEDVIDPEVGFAPDGTLYAAWRGADHRLHLARSPDLGGSWEGPWVVSPPPVSTTVFQALTVGENGRLGLAFLGTEQGGGIPDAVAQGAAWHLYIVTSPDANTDHPTFTSYQVTPDTRPVHHGPVCLGGSSCDAQRNLLDFIDSALAPDGTFYVTYTDGCVGGCTWDPSVENGDVHAHETAVAWLEGWRLEGGAPP